MPFQVIPRELAFFDLFDRLADTVALGVDDLTALVADLPNRDRYATRIRDLEHTGDDLTHQIIGLVNTTFVTPFDRKDIHVLASTLDDVLDSTEALADLLVLLRITEPLPQFVQQLQTLRRAVSAVALAVRDLRGMQGVVEACAQVRREEREGDWLFRHGVAELYAGDFAAMEVLMWKDLLEEAEAAVDKCEDIANTLESVVVKFA